ncbi:catechol 2,3-dioxygenase-like lactoylglutathione lyase family enzyme [Microbacterium foliorum]|uniref:Catechol 2,3-dioxygenase-like lactoylglutathione lyase family enzyme n=1 Tax=Microbacterium foliorum TaxID=104336 RepID=A0ABU1HNN2_9MICO|nr:VOC family protein [Microbacterium foliorum]MDR6140974.1 catechol 2,3-dioxygenase-like lactoylglutathione lyase family enzyme [Microbacterium foliorum]
MRGLHHVEIWVPDLDEASRSWHWLLTRLGLQLTGEWPDGQTWEAGGAYVTITTSPNLTSADHDRRRAGVNHLAFWGGTRAEVDAIVSDSDAHGWRQLYQARYPYAGGPDHYAGWVENDQGFKVEIVADPPA